MDKDLRNYNLKAEKFSFRIVSRFPDWQRRERDDFSSGERGNCGLNLESRSLQI